jgi:peptidoglycan/LPS O-acetylase OafA/YrhL
VNWSDLGVSGLLSTGTFPIQQPALRHTHVFASIICTAISFAGAFVYWQLVEQPALRLKPKRSYRRATAVGGLA